MSAAVDSRRQSRAELAAHAVALRAAGWTQKEIAADLGVSLSYTSALYTDPDRSKEVARKNGYRRPCPDCGALMDGSNGFGPDAPERCVDCLRAVQHEERYWTKARVVEAIQRFAVLHGRPPSATDWLRPVRDLGYPPVNTVQREFGSWAAAVEAAGFPRPVVGVYERDEEWRQRMSEQRTVWTRERIIAALQIWTVSHGRRPTYNDWGSASDEHPHAKTVQNKFGKWSTGLREAGVIE